MTLCYTTTIAAAAAAAFHAIPTYPYLNKFSLSASHFGYSPRLRPPPFRMSMSSSPSSAAASEIPFIALDEFAHRQFDGVDYSGTKVCLSKRAFMSEVRRHCALPSFASPLGATPSPLVDGYAPFCKHVFMPNFVPGLVDDAVRITPQIAPFIVTEYAARNTSELPVLKRFISRQHVAVPESKFLDLILYSREQIEKENKAMGKEVTLGESPWRLIAIKGQSVPYEIPMEPITMMRNELISQGGSGVSIDREAYMKSVEYWKDHVVVV